MNNEPVAWMVRRDDNITKGYGKEIQLTLMDATKPEFWAKGKIAKGYEVFPLYTHPVKEDEGKVCARCGAIAYDPVITQTVKELTDEEIDIIAEKSEFWKDHGYDDIEFKHLEFARAILRKAGEK